MPSPLSVAEPLQDSLCRLLPPVLLPSTTTFALCSVWFVWFLISWVTGPNEFLSTFMFNWLSFTALYHISFVKVSLCSLCWSSPPPWLLRLSFPFLVPKECNLLQPLPLIAMCFFLTASSWSQFCRLFKWLPKWLSHKFLFTFLTTCWFLYGNSYQFFKLDKIRIQSLPSLALV
jgi:hypothetical protein